MPGRNCWNDGGRELGPPELLRLDEMGRGGVVLCPSKVFCKTEIGNSDEQPGTPVPSYPQHYAGSPSPDIQSLGPRDELVAFLAVERPWPSCTLLLGGHPSPARTRKQALEGLGHPG